MHRMFYEYTETVFQPQLLTSKVTVTMYTSCRAARGFTSIIPFQYELPIQSKQTANNKVLFTCSINYTIIFLIYFP